MAVKYYLYICSHKKIKIINLNMKRLAFMIIAAALIAACGKKEPHYVITGNIDGADSVTFLLQKRVSGNTVVLDSAMVLNGKFVMKGGKVEYPEYLTLIAKNKRRGMNLFVENANITITGHFDSLYKVKVTGSVTQSEYDALVKSGEELTKSYSELSDSFAQANEAGDKAKMEEIRNKFSEIEQQMTMMEKDFIKNNPSSYASPIVLQGLSYEMEASEIESFISLLDTTLAKLPAMVTLKERAEKMKSVEIGQTAPDFTLNDVNDKPVSLYSLVGKSKLLLVDFWAAWCGPCRRENPNVVKVWKEFNKKGFDVLGVSLDRPGEKDTWLKAIKDDNLTWTHISDLQFWNCAAAKLYAVNSIPANFLLDEKGTIIARNLREEALYNKVKELLSAK
jgi:peroxiredoxin